MHDYIGNPLYNILKEKGVVESTGLRHLKVYEDDKVRIAAMLSLQTNAKAYDFIQVELKIPSSSISNQVAFGLISKREDTVLVFGARNDEEIFYRQGRWVKYIQNLSHQIDVSRMRLEKLNGVEIDDNLLFPDLD